MKTYQKFALAPAALFFAISPLIASAHESGLGINLGVNTEVQAEQRVERSDKDNGHEKRQFVMPWGIWKKFHVSSTTTASTTATTTVHTKASFIANLRSFFKNLVSGSYNVSITATDQNGHATSTSLGAFIKK